MGSAGVETVIASRGWALYWLGVFHIATGWDHLVFLFGLLVMQTSKRRLVWVVTAFTAAHSLTLALAASDLVSVPGDWVEPGIALTIAYVGMANLLKFNHGVLLAFAFGLVHGFGFAGALSETLGIPVGGGGRMVVGAGGLQSRNREFPIIARFAESAFAA